MSYFLPDSATEADKNKLRKFIKKMKEPHARDRARAVLWRMEGKSRETIASLLGINRDTVSNWITFWRQKGIEGLKSNWKGGNKYKLSPAAKQEVKKVVRTKSPKDLGYGKDYKYPHNYKDAKAEQDYLPEVLKGKKYYTPPEKKKDK